MRVVFTLWLLANGTKDSMNQAMPISLSVQPLGDVVIAEIVLDRVGNEGTHPLSPPGPGTNWADWSNTMGREMYLCRALDRLNFEYPSDDAS